VRDRFAKFSFGTPTDADGEKKELLEEYDEI